MTPQIVLTLQLFLVTTVISEMCNNNPVKYEVVQLFPKSYNYETTKMEKEVISSLPYTFSISITSDIPIICKGLLQIIEGSHYLYIDERNLESIEPGAFDNQNLTEEIRFFKNKLTILKTGTFKDLPVKTLDFSYNQIATIEEGAFENLPNLWQVHLSRNKIAAFHQNSFLNTPSMLFFDIGWNQLQELGANWFSFMTKDKKTGLGLGPNQIKEIHPKAFEEINVWNLNLTHNQLKEIPAEIFTKNDIQLLDLENNQIENLPEAFYRQKNLTDVVLNGNPLGCEVQRKLKGLAEDTRARISYEKSEC